MKLNYSSNNSGGRWWLTDGDWRALERAGWVIDWYADRDDDGYGMYKNGRFLDALASGAYKIVASKAEATEAVEEWEGVTGQSATSEGCNCCGQPHYFTLYNQVPCTHFDTWNKVQYLQEDCAWCEGTGLKDDYVSSFDVSPNYVEYKRSWD